MADYLYRKNLTKCFQAFRVRFQQKALTSRLKERAESHHSRVVQDKLIKLLQKNVLMRAEMKKDAITRQVIDEEVGDDEFFVV